jgi:hypothetical protein
MRRSSCRRRPWDVVVGPTSPAEDVCGSISIMATQAIWRWLKLEGDAAHETLAFFGRTRGDDGAAILSVAAAAVDLLGFISEDIDQQR